MRIEAIESRITELRYAVRDLDAQISQLHLPEAQITSAGQLVYLNNQKEALVKKRNLFRKHSAELVGLRRLSLEKAEEIRNQQHLESTRLSKVSIGIDLISAAPLVVLVKWLASKF